MVKVTEVSFAENSVDTFLVMLVVKVFISVHANENCLVLFSPFCNLVDNVINVLLPGVQAWIVCLMDDSVLLVVHGIRTQVKSLIWTYSVSGQDNKLFVMCSVHFDV